MTWEAFGFDTWLRTIDWFTQINEVKKRKDIIIILRWRINDKGNEIDSR